MIHHTHLIESHCKLGIFHINLYRIQYRMHNKSEALQSAQKANKLLNNSSSQKLYDIISHDKVLDLRL